MGKRFQWVRWYIVQIKIELCRDGWNAYLEDLAAENTIRVQLPDQHLCEANFSLDLKKAQQQIAVIKSVVCHEVVKP